MENMANNNWKITCLHYGTLSCYKSLFDGGLDQTRYPFVYSGYLLQKDGRNILVDTGVHQDNIVDGKAWADSPAEGGNQFVLDALKGEGLTPDDIEIVMYTHLHNDHAGGMLLFPNSQHLFQRDEYYNMLHPLPTQKIRRDYDPRTPGDLAQIKNVRMIDGDFDMGNGIRLFKVPGHSLGGMAIQVQTAEGKDVITDPKTPKSNRVIQMPAFLCDEMQDYFKQLYGLEPDSRIFPLTKHTLKRGMEFGCKASGVKVIRIHDLRHSHVSLLINMGYSAVAIGNRVGHESVEITYRYAHLFPTVQKEMADKLNVERGN